MTLKAKSLTYKDGRTVTSFVRMNKQEEEVLFEKTLKDGSSFEEGSKVEIYEQDNLIYIKITTKLNEDLEME